MESRDAPHKLEWAASLPFWRNTVVIRQMALVFALPLVALLWISVVAEWPLYAEELLFDGKVAWIAAAISYVAALQEVEAAIARNRTCKHSAAPRPGR